MEHIGDGLKWFGFWVFLGLTTFSCAGNLWNFSDLRVAEIEAYSDFEMECLRRDGVVETPWFENKRCVVPK